jgi:short-subunit dehydrogenase
VRAAVTRLEEQIGPTDLLVASAGIGIETPAESFRAEDFTKQIQVNLIGVIHTLDAVLPGMCRRQSGHVAALSSMASYRGLPHMGGYCASKAGVNSLLDALRVELRPKGIAVTTICPAWVRTPLTTPLGLPDKELMGVEEAVRLILRALRARKPFLAFPASHAWQARLLRHTPQPISDWLTRQWARKMGKVSR